MKILRYLRLNMKILFPSFHTITHFHFWGKRTWDMWSFCFQKFRNNRIHYKLDYFLRNLQTSLVNKSIILKIKNVKLSGYRFNVNTHIKGDFQTWISIPLTDNSLGLWIENWLFLINTRIWKVFKAQTS